MMEVTTPPELLNAVTTDLADLKTRRAEIGATARKLEAEIAVLESQIDSSVVSGVDPSRLEKQLRAARESLEATERHAGALDREIQKKTREANALELGSEQRRLETECDGDQGAARAWKARYVELCRELGAHLAAGVTLHAASKARAERLASLTSRRDFSPAETDIYEDAVAFGRLRDELAEEAAELAYRDGGRRLRFDVPVFGVTGRPA